VRAPLHHPRAHRGDPAARRQRRKILSGLITACQKRPVSIEELEAITQRVEQQVNESEEREVDTERIGSLVMDELRKLDQVAYVRFASVYRNFASPEDFAEIAEQVRRPPPKAGRSRRKLRVAGDGEPPA
jgi:transcriptional repressor NrdR